MYNKKIIFILLMLLLPITTCFDLYDIYDNSIKYKLRDMGPAGGWIFYINPNWEKDGWRYLETSPSDQSIGIVWWTTLGVATGATLTAVGTGRANTANIVNDLGRASAYAARTCDENTSGGYSDWFMPSSGELDMMYNNLKAYSVGNFSDDLYWSSTETNAGGACRKDFTSPGTNACAQAKNTNSRIRAIRAF